MMRTRVRLVMCALAGALILGCGPNGDPPSGSGPGSFQGELRLRPVGEGRMELLADYVYVDAAGKRWKAPKGYPTDGASIPRPLWSIVGAPFTGEYLHAAVIHDVYCEARYRVDETADQVHRMFFEACLAAGVAEKFAKLLYRAVCVGGPVWPDPPPPPPDGSIRTRTLPAELPRPRWIPLELPPVSDAAQHRADERLRQEFLQAARWIESEDPSLEDIERWTPPR